MKTLCLIIVIIAYVYVFLCFSVCTDTMSDSGVVTSGASDVVSRNKYSYKKLCHSAKSSSLLT